MGWVPPCEPAFHPKFKTSRSSYTYNYFERPKPHNSSALSACLSLFMLFPLSGMSFDPIFPNPNPHWANSWSPGHPLRFSTKILSLQRSLPDRAKWPSWHSYSISITSHVLHVITVSCLCVLSHRGTMGDYWRTGIQYYFFLNPSIW